MSLSHDSAKRVAHQCETYRRANATYEAIATYMADKTPETLANTLKVSWSWGSSCTGYEETAAAVQALLRQEHFRVAQKALTEAKAARDQAFADLQHVVAHHG